MSACGTTLRRGARPGRKGGGCARRPRQSRYPTYIARDQDGHASDGTFSPCMRIRSSLFSPKLNQTQLQALQTVQNQQGKLIAAISPVLPLLQGIAPHLENLRRDLSDGLRDMREGGVHRTAVAAVSGAPAGQSPHGALSQKSTPACPSDSTRRKKRKLGDDKDTFRMSNGSGPPKGVNLKSPDLFAANLTANDLSLPTPLAPPVVPSTSPLRLKDAHPMRNPYQTPRRPPLVDLLKPNATPGSSRSGLISTTQSGVSALLTHAESLGASTHTSCTPRCPPKDGSAALTLPKPLMQGTPKNADSLGSTTSTLSQSSAARHGSMRAGVGGSRTQSKAAITHHPNGRPTISSGAIFATPARQGLQHKFTTSVDPQLTVAPSDSEMPSMNKPLSIKDIRTLTATPAFVSARYISLLWPLISPHPPSATKGSGSYRWTTMTTMTIS